MSKAYWIGLGILILTICIVFGMLFFSLLGVVKQKTNEFHAMINETLEEYGVMNTTLGQRAMKHIERGFAIIHSIYAVLGLVFIISLLVFIAEVVIWYAARRL